MNATNDGSVIKRKRVELGLPIVGLSAISGVPPATISAIEKWGAVPGPLLRARLSAALGCNEAEIFPNVEKPKVRGA